MPIRWRLALLYSAVLLMALLVFSSSVYVLLNYSLTTEMDRSLNNKAMEIIKSTMVAGGAPQLRQFVLPDVDVFAGPDIYVQVVTIERDVATKSRNLSYHNLPIEKEVFDQVIKGKAVYATLMTENAHLRVLYKPFLAGKRIVGVLQVARPLKSVTSVLVFLRNILIVGSMGSLLLALWLGWFLAGRALAPIRHLTREAKVIGEQGDLRRRVDDAGTKDELGELAYTFNNMLNSLEVLYRRLAVSLAAQQRFVSDASHELRTPLTSIQGNIDFLLQMDREDKTLSQEAMEDIASETRRLSRLVKDLLSMARADRGLKLELDPLELQPALEEVLRQARFLQKGHDFSADLVEAENITIQADADYFKQLLLIFFDNAFKHTPAKAKVTFKAEKKGDTIALIFIDQGPGIPEDSLPHLFERFYRVQSSRSGEGTGLGLAIAKWIADEHQAQIVVESQLGHGTVFTISFPILRAPQGAL